MNKIIISFFALLTISTLSLTLVDNITIENQTIAATVLPAIMPEKIPEAVHLVFVGDIMLGRGVAGSVKKNFADDFNQLFVNTSFIKDADIAFANLEGPVSVRGRNVGSKFSFRFEPRVVTALKDAGFDILSVANNHSGDWTKTAFEDTLTNLNQNGILFAGGGTNLSDASTVRIIEKNGQKIGFLGFTDVGPTWLQATDTQAGILNASLSDYKNIIADAKVQVDTLFVSVHWGDEYIYLTHSKHQETLAHAFVDAGADFIIGHHPHVREDIETYKNGTIAYSLGNFIFDQYFSPRTMEGGALFVRLTKGEVPVISEKSVTFDRQSQPQLPADPLLPMLENKTY